MVVKTFETHLRTVSESLNFNPICKNLSIHANDNEIFLI